jgi:hypothetical protein
MSIHQKKWQAFIESMEQLMNETNNADKKEELRRSIRSFRSMMEHGEPWPGERRKQKAKSIKERLRSLIDQAEQLKANTDDMEWKDELERSIEVFKKKLEEIENDNKG